MAARQPASANHTKCGSVLTPPLTCLATQGLAPSYHNSNHDTAVIIKPRNVMVFEGDFVTDMIAFAASVEQCLGIRGTDITAWLNTWWDGLSLAFKKTGRAVQVSSLLLTAAPRISLLLLTTVAYCGCCSLMLTAHCISLLLLTAAAHCCCSLLLLTFLAFAFQTPQPTTVPVSVVTWFLTESQERRLAAFGIAEKPADDVIADSKQLYNFITDQILPSVNKHTFINCVRDNMFDIIDTLTFMHPGFAADPTFCAFNNLYTTSPLESALDLYTIQTYTPILVQLSVNEPGCMSILPLGDKLELSIELLASALRLDFTGMGNMLSLIVPQVCTYAFHHQHSQANPHQKLTRLPFTLSGRAARHH